jgi:hypothetical protein
MVKQIKKENGGALFALREGTFYVQVTPSMLFARIGMAKAKPVGACARNHETGHTRVQQSLAISFRGIAMFLIVTNSNCPEILCHQTKSWLAGSRAMEA